MLLSTYFYTPTENYYLCTLHLVHLVPVALYALLPLGTYFRYLWVPSRYLRNLWVPGTRMGTGYQDGTQYTFKFQKMPLSW